MPAVVGLHLGIGLTMQLDYSAQALSVIIVIVNWVFLTDWFAAQRASRGMRPRVKAAG